VSRAYASSPLSAGGEKGKEGHFSQGKQKGRWTEMGENGKKGKEESIVIHKCSLYLTTRLPKESREKESRRKTITQRGKH